MRSIAHLVAFGTCELMTDIDTRDVTPVTVLANYRQTVIRETADVVLNAAAATADYRSDSFPKVAALLTSSLEELKVAEEELAEQNNYLLAQRDEYMRHVDYERRLFEFAPVALLVTNLVGSITEANRATQTLLGQPEDQLDRKPLISLVPLEDRRTFRSELARITVAQGVSDWKFRLNRTRDVPVVVSAAAHLVGRGNRSGGAALFWSLRPIG